MANKKSMGSFNFPTGGSHAGGNPISGIMPFVQQQALMGRSAAGQQTMPNEVPVGRTDPFSGIRTQTPEGIGMNVQEDLRKKASEDAYKLSQAYKFVKSLRKDYTEAYKGMKDKGGLQGGAGATGEYFTGVVGRQNDPLRRYIDNLSASGPSLGKFGGDTGNFALQEQIAALKRLPKATPNLDVSRGFMPDDPDYGMSKFDEVENIFLDKMLEAQEVAKTGTPVGGYGKTSTQAPNAAPPGNASSAGDQTEGRVRVRNKVSGQTGTVSLSKFDPNKYEKA